MWVTSSLCTVPNSFPSLFGAGAGLGGPVGGWLNDQFGWYVCFPGDPRTICNDFIARRSAFLFQASNVLLARVLATYLQSITGPHPSIIDSTGLDQSQYPASRGSSCLDPSHQASANRFSWIVDARSDCGVFATRVIPEIDRGTTLVTPANMGSHICQRYMGSYFHHRRN